MPETGILEKRRRVLGSSPLFYDEPLQIVRGEGVYLYAEDGRRYLDCYNNVPIVGHCQPDVVKALTRQAEILNIHTRYIHRTILDYGERLLATFHASLDKVMFTCSGSEANDQALRIARMPGRGRGIICTNYAYHGNTAAVDEVSPLFDGAARSLPEVRTVPYPDSYRPLDGLGGKALKAAYLKRIEAAIASLEEAGVGFAGIIFCPIFANEGLPKVPGGLLADAVELVHRAGGLVIADEVQAGFGRTGRMWGQELMGFIPDIVTIGKPMGNGYPIAALVSRTELLEEYRKRVFYFNTFGGNPVACAAAAAVLDVIERDGLIEHARIIGDYIRAGFSRLATKHPLIGDIRGYGMWVGVELVRDRRTKEPAAEETWTVVNRLKDGGVLINRIGEFDNVLKIRPPLPFGREHADVLLEAVDEVLHRL